MSPAVPYQDMQTIEASSEEMGSGMIYSKPEIGSRVIAKWKDRFFYPGVISRVDKARFQVKFDDGDILFIRPGDILLINRLPIGQPVMVPTGPESYYEGGLIVGHVRQGGTILYSVEQDAGNREAFRMSQVILSEDQAKCLVSDTNCLVSTTHPNVSDVKMSDVTLDNLMEGKRRTGSRYAQKDIGSPNIKSWKEKESKNSHKETESKTENVPATAKSSKKRKYTIDVPPSATSTPTPNRAKRHKGDDFDTTPHLGYSQDSPIVPLTRRSPRKSRVGLFETSSSKIFEGMLFLITYVEKSQEDKSAEKEFLRDSSLSNDESASESTDDTVLLNKALLRQKIEMAGGTFLPNFEESKIQAAKHCFLISDTYQRTIKYFQCLAAAIPCVSHLWIHHSIAQSKVLDYRSYMLQAGISIEKKKVMEWNCRRGALMGLKVLIISTDLQYKQQWLSILNAAGCETVNKLPRTGAGDVNLVLADKSITESSLRRIRSLDLPIVGTEWVIQSLIMGTRVEFSGHPKYQYDAV